MKLFFLIVFSLVTVSELSAQWVPWQIPTPRETHQIASDGTAVIYGTFSLPAGMNYHAHADGWIYYDGSNDVADACFFNNLFLHISPDLGGKLGIKITTAPATENWFYNLAGKPGYNQNHVYDASIPSAGNSLSVRYYDTDEPSVKPQNYGDNTGFVTVEIAQETPRVAVQFDTVFFRNVPVGGSLRKLDSIEAYGLLGYRVDNVSTTGPSASKFTASSQNTVGFTITETTNEFEFIYRPDVPGADTAYFHIYSSNAYGPDQHKIIVLIGNSVGAKLSVDPDTLHFGALALNASKTLVEKIHNSGPIAAAITSIVMTTPGMPFTFTPSSTIVNQFDSSSIDVTFAPVVLGNFLAEFLCTTSDGATVRFYADGYSVGAKLSVNPDTLHFGPVALSASKTLTEKIYNSGPVAANITSIVMTTPGMPFFFTPSSTLVNKFDSASISVTFTPPVVGNFLAEFLCTTSDGATVKFYADGLVGKAIPNIDKPVLDFGQVVIGRSRSLTSHISNVGNVRLFIDSTVNTNPLEYGVLGAQGAHFYDGGGSGEIYTFTFKPVIHIPKAQNHDGSFIFYYSDGTSSTIIFKGYDHEPLTERLSIDTNYFGNPGKELSVYQRLTDALDSTIVPERVLSERINYDPAILDFIRIEKAILFSDPDWKLTTTPGIGYIDISLAATTKQFGAAGAIFKIVFKVHPDVAYDTTYLVQNNINFFDPIEPLASSQTGRIIIGDACSPVGLKVSFIPPISSIDQNNPNPVTSVTEIPFGIGSASNNGSVAVKLYLIDAMGKIVKTLIDEEKAPGWYKYKLDASSLPSGIYRCILEANGWHGERSVVVVK
jgi:Flp pilus assembly protein TadG